ncbi:MAG: addiction module protein [Acidobacteria bacterium]|nr:addiction module protein [Acidobacteriota bacterium]
MSTRFPPAQETFRSSERIESPEWHKQIFDERRQRANAGKARFEDWENAKMKIRESVMVKES